MSTKIKYQFWQSRNATFILWLFRSGERIAIVVVVFLHLLLVFPLAAILNIWIDEAFTLESTREGLIHAVWRALDYEFQPPLYFIIMTLWRSLNDSIFFARIFSIICTTSTLILAGALARRYLPGIRPWLVAAVVAFNPLTVYAAVDIRFYAPALFLSGMLLLLYYDGYIAKKPSPAARLWYTITAIAALYTHYFLGFLLAAGGVALIILRDTANLRKYLVNMMITAIFFAPLAVVTLHQMQNIKDMHVLPTQTFQAGCKIIWQAAWKHVLPPIGWDNTLDLEIIRGWISRLAVPLILIIAFARRQRPPMILFILLIFAVVVGLFFFGVAVRLGPDFMRMRHTTELYLPVLLAMLALIRYAGGGRLATFGAFVSLVFSALCLVETYAPLAKHGDWVRVSRYIEQHEQRSEPILMFVAEFVLDFGYHYTGCNQLLAIPRIPRDWRFDYESQVLDDESEILMVLKAHIGPTGRFWLITSGGKPNKGINYHPEILEGFITRRCNVLSDESFYGSRVRLLELRPRVNSSEHEPSHIAIAGIRKYRTDSSGFVGDQ